MITVNDGLMRSLLFLVILNRSTFRVLCELLKRENILCPNAGH